jgi:hypothetical protein
MTTPCKSVINIPKAQCLFESRVSINTNTDIIDTMLCAASGQMTARTQLVGGVSLINAGNGISFYPPGANGAGNVTLSKTVCPPWNAGLTGKQLYTEIGSNKVSAQHANNFVLKKHISDTIERSPAMPGSETLSFGNSIFSIMLNKYSHSVLLPDDRIFMVPSTSTTSAIYDPARDIFITPTAGGYPGNINSYANGVLLPDGRIFMVPFDTLFARTYNCTTDLLNIETAAGSYVIPGGYSKGVLLPNGTIFHVPFNSTKDYIYNPATLTSFTSTKTYTGARSFSDGVLMYNGCVFMVPYDSTTAAVYDPSSNTCVDITHEAFGGGGRFSGGVLLPDGKVYCVPTRRTQARIYNPSTMSYTIPNGTYSIMNETDGGCLLPDGRVLLHPKGVGSTIKIYNPTRETVHDAYISPTKYGQCNKGVVLRDGDVIYTPRDSTAACRFKYFHQASFSNTFLTGVYNR